MPPHVTSSSPHPLQPLGVGHNRCAPTLPVGLRPDKFTPSCSLPGGSQQRHPPTAQPCCSPPSRRAPSFVPVPPRHDTYLGPCPQPCLSLPWHWGRRWFWCLSHPPPQATTWTGGGGSLFLLSPLPVRTWGGSLGIAKRPPKHTHTHTCTHTHTQSRPSPRPRRRGEDVKTLLVTVLAPPRLPVPWGRRGGRGTRGGGHSLPPPPLPPPHPPPQAFLGGGASLMISSSEGCRMMSAKTRGGGCQWGLSLYCPPS